MNYIHLLFFVDPFLNFAPGSWELEIYRNLRGLPLRTPGRCHGAERAVPGGPPSDSQWLTMIVNEKVNYHIYDPVMLFFLLYVKLCSGKCWHPHERQLAPRPPAQIHVAGVFWYKFSSNGIAPGEHCKAARVHPLQQANEQIYMI